MPLYSSQQQQRPWSITPLYLINTNAKRRRWWPSVEDGCFVKDPAALWHDVCVDLYGGEGWRELRSSPSIIHRCAEPQTDSLQWWSCCPPSHICLYGRARESSSFFFLSCGSKHTRFSCLLLLKHNELMSRWLQRSCRGRRGAPHSELVMNATRGSTSAAGWGGGASSVGSLGPPRWTHSHWPADGLNLDGPKVSSWTRKNIYHKTKNVLLVL